jgi:type IV secretory pathway VirB10-like protein
MAENERSGVDREDSGGNEFHSAAHGAVDSAVASHDDEFRSSDHIDVDSPEYVEDGTSIFRGWLVYGAGGLMVVIFLIAVIWAFSNYMRDQNARAHPTPAPQPTSIATAAGVNPLASVNPNGTVAGGGNFQGSAYCEGDTTGDEGVSCSPSPNPDCTPTNANGSAAAGFVFGAAAANQNQNPACTPNYHRTGDVGTKGCPAGYAPAQGNLCVPTATPNPCPTGFAQVVVNSGQAPVCVQQQQNGTQAGGGYAGTRGPPATSSPLPAQGFTVATPAANNPQEQQAQGDLAQRGGAVVAAQPQPVYVNGRFVGFVYPAGSGIVATDVGGSTGGNVAAANQQSFVSPAPAGNTSSTDAAPRPADDFAGGQNAHTGYRQRVSEFQVCALTMLHLSLTSKIDSSAPGYFTFRFRDNVMDCATHRHIVIPQGTEGGGQYDSRLVSYSTRLLGVITLLKFSDGREFDLPNEGVTDSLGAAGLTGDVNRHTGNLLGTAAILTALTAVESVLTSSGQQQSIYAQPTIGQQIATAAGGQLANIGNSVMQSQLNRPPTIVIDPTPQHPYYFDALVMHDLPLDRFEVARHDVLQPVYATPAPRVQAPAPVLVPTPQPTPTRPARFCCK